MQGITFWKNWNELIFVKGNKVAVHTSDVLWSKNLIKTHSQASLNTTCIVDLYILNWTVVNSIAMHCNGQYTNSNMSVDHINFQGD